MSGRSRALSDAQLATELVRLGGSVASARFGTRMVSYEKSGPSDIVTESDISAQRAMLELLSVERPGDGVLAEEGVEIVGRADRRWVIDPVDGTLAYQRGLPWWCTAVALEVGGQWTLSAVFDPCAGEVFTAQSGEQPRCNGRRISVGPAECLNEAVVHTWLDSASRSVAGFTGVLGALIDRAVAVKAGGSGTQAMSWIAAGRLDAFVEVYPSGEAAWDWEPGSNLVSCAGGATWREGSWRVAAASRSLVDELGALIRANV